MDKPGYMVTVPIPRRRGKFYGCHWTAFQVGFESESQKETLL